MWNDTCPSIKINLKLQMRIWMQMLDQTPYSKLGHSVQVGSGSVDLRVPRGLPRRCKAQRAVGRAARAAECPRTWNGLPQAACYDACFLSFRQLTAAILPHARFPLRACRQCLLAGGDPLLPGPARPGAGESRLSLRDGRAGRPCG